MNSTNYADAVAAIRSMEEKLLTISDLKRFIENFNDDNFPDFQNELEYAWDFIRSYASDSKELEILLYRNDFHNIKAALKSLIMNEDPQNLFLKPTNLSLTTLYSNIASKSYAELPEHIQSAAEQAYNIFTQSNDIQIADAVTDVSCLKAMADSAEIYGNDFMKQYAHIYTVYSDIKTAYRCCIFGASEEFINYSLCGSRELDKASLIRAAMNRCDSFLSYLENSGFKDSADALSKSSAEFELMFDNKLMDLAESAHSKAFGIEPLAAYFISKEAEVKNLRIISVLRKCGVSYENIIERMRRLYV